MGKVVMHNVVSVDGFIADEHDGVGPLFDWYGNGDHELDAPAYAICDDTAIRVVDGEVDVVTEGHWQVFEPSGGRS